MIDRNREIEIINSWDGVVYLESQISPSEGYTVDANSSVLVPFSDVKYIQGRSNMFNIGTLEISEQDSDVLKELGINTKGNNYFTRKMISDIVLDPQDEDFERIINITSLETLENFKRVIIEEQEKGEYEINSNSMDYVEARIYELKHKRYKSQLPIKRSKKYKRQENELYNDNIELGVVKEKEPKTTSKPKGRPRKNTVKEK